MFRSFVFLLLFSACAGSVAHGAGIVVVIEGVEGELLENVRNSLGIEQYKDDANLSRNWVWRLHSKAVEEIHTALKPWGYYRPTVVKALLRLEDGWKASYTIDTGDVVPIGSADVQVLGEGQADPAFVKLLKEQPLLAGAPLDHVRYDKLKAGLQKLALERGYFDAKFAQHEIRLDLEAYEANIVLHFDSGPRYRFGPVTFRQNSLSEDFLARYVRFKPGDAYSTSAVLGLQDALTGSDYFSSVDVNPRQDQAEDLQVPVEVSLVPHKRNKYALGVGFGTDTGARLSAGFERRRVNRRGHRIAAGLQLSQIKNSLSAKYLVPLKDPRTEQLVFSAGYFDSDTEDISSKTTSLGVSRSGRRWGLNETLGLKFQREDFSVGEEDDTTFLLMPEASWMWLRADDRTYTSRGARLQFTLRGASESLLSDVSFLQARLQAKLVQKVFGASRIILRGDAGTSFVSGLSGLAGHGALLCRW